MTGLPGQLSRRRFLTVGGGVVTAAALSGCGSLLGSPTEIGPRSPWWTRPNGLAGRRVRGSSR